MKTLARATVALSFFALSGCASLITGGELIRPGEPTGAIRINNASRGPINVVLISSCSTMTYGLNRLPSGTAIPAGRSYDFRVSAGCWAVAAGRTGTGDARTELQVRPGSRANFYVRESR
ncbi:MAG: hypothetical protein Q8O54_09295 [Brevundimonas sp.]|nr:hypothetical protein [Brevundimonas sp.]